MVICEHCLRKGAKSVDTLSMWETHAARSTGLDAQAWLGRVDGVIRLVRSGYDLPTACAALRVPRAVIGRLRSVEPNRYQELMSVIDGSMPSLFLATSPKSVLRIRQIAVLGNTTERAIRRAVHSARRPIPEPDGRDYLGYYWAEHRRHDWERWFVDCRGGAQVT